MDQLLMLTLVIMTNISSGNVDSASFKYAEMQLQKILGRMTTSSSDSLLTGLLTESERVMLVKRFGAIFLLHNGYTPYRIAQMLGISEPTVHRIKAAFDQGIYTSLLQHIAKREQSAFLEALQDFALSRVSHTSRRRLTKRCMQ